MTLAGLRTGWLLWIAHMCSYAWRVSMSLHKHIKSNIIAESLLTGNKNCTWNCCVFYLHHHSLFVGFFPFTFLLIFLSLSLYVCACFFLPSYDFIDLSFKPHSSVRTPARIHNHEFIDAIHDLIYLLIDKYKYSSNKIWRKKNSYSKSHEWMGSSS